MRQKYWEAFGSPLGVMPRHRLWAAATYGCSSRSNSLAKTRGIEQVNTKSFVDDLILGRGDVSFRAASTLRDTES